MEMDLDGEARAAYTRSFDEYARRLQVMAQRNNGRYVGLPTTVSLEEAIFGPILKAGGLQ